MAEDPADSVAALLWRSAWRGAGLTTAPMRVENDEAARKLWQAVAEGQRVEWLRRAIPQALAASGPDSARALLEAAEPFELPRGRAAASLLLGTVAMAARDWGTAIGALHESLRQAASPEQRFDAFRLLAQAYRAFGDEQQAANVIERAVDEAPDARSRAEAEGWRRVPAP
jgi:lipopolysaccharide biosynthesis regulator YciM